jgi:nitrate/nitrite transporter NarK
MPADNHISVGDIFKNWEAWILMMNYVTSFGGFLAIGNFLPNHLAKYHGTDDTTTLLITAAFLTLTCIMRILWGPITDKF